MRERAHPVIQYMREVTHPLRSNAHQGLERAVARGTGDEVPCRKPDLRVQPPRELAGRPGANKAPEILLRVQTCFSDIDFELWLCGA